MASTQTYLVVFHTPGPAWKTGVDFREQPGVEEHVAHYGRLLAEGRLQMGGPFLDVDRGGMMVATPHVGLEELDEFASSDPAIESGLLVYEIRRWHVAMRTE